MNTWLKLASGCCLVACAFIPAQAADVPSEGSQPVSALEALPQVVRVRCQAIEIDLERIPAELVDEVSPDTDEMRIFRDERNRNLPWVRPADPNDVQQLLQKLVKCGAAKIMAEPTISVVEGQSGETEIVTVVPAVNSPIAQAYCFVSCTFSASPWRYDQGWIVETKTEVVTEPDIGSNEVVPRAPLPALPGQPPPKWVPALGGTSMGTTISFPRGKVIRLGGSVTSRSVDDGKTYERTCQIVLLSVEESPMNSR